MSDTPHPEPKRGQPIKDAGGAATSELYFRVSPKRKAAYVKAANRKKLAEWVFEQLDKAAGYDPNATDSPTPQARDR